MYCKLFASLYQGTLRGKSHEILVFTNLLANTDQYGIVDKHFKAIAEEVGLTVDEVKEAIKTLEAPDPESRSPDNDGARLVRMDDHRIWGWRVVNFLKYRAIKNEEDRREQNRLAQERWRNKSKQPSARVSKRKHESAQTEAEAEAEAEADTESKVPAIAGGGGHKAFIEGWCQNFKSAFGFDYKMNGGRDGKAVKCLLGTNILRIDLLEIAKEAWKRPTLFACRQAATIHGFYTNLNNIRVEIKNENNGRSNPARGRGVVDRNATTCNRPEAYANWKPKPEPTDEP